MSIHGYLSTGKWQVTATDASINSGLKSIEYKYGFTIFPWLNNYRAKKFNKWYQSEVVKSEHGLKVDEPFHRPSIVAHSLGTWIIAKALKKYPDIKFDKIFLHGSIIPREYDWYKLILNDQVNKIIVEKTKNDSVIKWGFFLTGSRFPSSQYGFIQKSSFIKYEEVDNFGHSDFQYSKRLQSQFALHLKDIPTQLKVIHGSELEMFSLKKYFNSTLKIDKHNYGVEYEENPVTIERAIEWAQVEKNIWSFIINSYNKDVVGYINILALDDETYTKFKTGNLTEDDIRANNICAFDIQGNLNLVIMSIALNEYVLTKTGSVLNSKPGELLIFTLSRKILELTGHGKRLNSITSVAWTDIGEKLCKSFGMIRTDYNYSNHPIYSVTVDELKRKNMDEVRPLCKWWINQIKKG